MANHIHEGKGVPPQQLGEVGDIYRDDTNMVVSYNAKAEPVHISFKGCQKYFKWFDGNAHKKIEQAEWITIEEAFKKHVF